MDVRLHHPEDRQRLTNLARIEANAKQRDRYRAVLLALDGRQALQIVRMLGRSRRWCWTGPGGHRSLAASLPRAGADQVPTRPCARIDQNPDQRSLQRSGQTVACLTVGQ